MNKAIGDLWMPAVCFVLLLASIGQGLKQLFTSGSVTSPLAISIIWAVYNAIPPFLVLWYAIVGKGVMLQYLCRLLMLTSFFCGAAAIGLLWGLYPEEYNFNKVSPSAFVVPRLCSFGIASMSQQAWLTFLTSLQKLKS